jgi:ring-1,2-phenylacetyl-CoA epoxidase subunit PaaC
VDPELQSALAALLLAAGDDELILGHRNSEWCGQAPILEEDIAFANLALDEIAHAQAWYELHAGLVGEDPQTYPDRLVYFRAADDFRCLRLVELPRGDWAFSMLRQYFFDLYENIYLRELSASTYPPLAETAARLRKEEVYHLRHARAWIVRLGLGTDESHSRLQAALDALWPYTQQLFLPGPGESALSAAGIAPERSRVQQDWMEQAHALVQECELQMPAAGEPPASRREHISGFKVLIDELQSVARLDPEAVW